MRPSDRLGKSELVWMWTQMLRVREFEERVKRTFVEHPGVLRGHTHLGDGAEASIIGALATRNPGDPVMPSYRCHGYPLVLGTPSKNIMAELYGRRDGICNGFGGSMHLADPAHDFPGATGIIGAGIAHAAGVALTAQVKKTSQVVYSFFGDGASKQGAFHETLNIAAVWKLPVVFVCENNLYMEYTPIGDVTAVPHPAADRAAAYGLPRIVVDGNDADAVYRTAQAAFEKARAGEGPSLIECLTYRHSGHSRADPAKYRPEGELERWKQRDPIKLYRERLLQFGVTEDAIAKIDAEVRKVVDDATEACKAAPVPPVDILTTDVYADGGWAWRN